MFEMKQIIYMKMDLALNDLALNVRRALTAVVKMIKYVYNDSYISE